MKQVLVADPQILGSGLKLYLLGRAGAGQFCTADIKGCEGNLRVASFIKVHYPSARPTYQSVCLSTYTCLRTYVRTYLPTPV
jgi:hypothetical protein